MLYLASRLTLPSPLLSPPSTSDASIAGMLQRWRLGSMLLLLSGMLLREVAAPPPPLQATPALILSRGRHQLTSRREGRHKNRTLQRRRWLRPWRCPCRLQWHPVEQVHLTLGASSMSRL